MIFRALFFEYNAEIEQKNHFRMGTKESRKQHAGFTLLEVMVAMAIMAITLMAVLDSQSMSISLAGEAKFSTSASFLAQKKMAEMEIIKAKDLASDSGDFGDNYPNYSWELTVGDPTFEAPENVTNHLKQIDLTVTWGENERYTYILRQYRFSPG